jgi:hypothetical protein
MKFQCSACLARGKDWQGSDPQCGFLDDGSFTPNNWACATLLALRELGAVSVHPEREESVGVHHVEEGSIVLCWYKRRGACHVALLVTSDEEDVRPLRLSDAEQALGVAP